MVSLPGWLIFVAVFCCMAAGTKAEGNGRFLKFSYADKGDFIQITKYQADGVGALEIPSAISGKPVKAISGEAFKGCAGLKSVTISSGVTSIERAAFLGCSKLSSVTIPSGVTRIGTSAFYGCSELASVTIPASVTSIGNSAFEGCRSLSKVTIEPGVTTIGAKAFCGCKVLTSVTIPASVSWIGEAAFSCSELKNVEFSGNAPKYFEAFPVNANSDVTIFKDPSADYSGPKSGFTVYCQSGATGFPTKWEGYPVLRR